MDEARLKRLGMRSWRRGTKEMDLILGPFADVRLGEMTPAELDVYEALLAEDDQSLYGWIARGATPPAPYAALVGEIRRAAGAST